MSRTYRKPSEYYLWKNEDEYAAYRFGWYAHRRTWKWKVDGKWTMVNEDFIKNDAREDYRSWKRDGAVHRGSRSKYFSDLCARDLRAKTKQYLARQRWDDEMPPDRKNGKHFIWTVW